MWIIRREADEDGVIRDIQQTDFFDFLCDQSGAEQYNFLIVRMTKIVVQVFPVLDCDIHDNVFGNRQYIGRGADDSDGDEEEIVEYDEEEELPTTRNPYILDEVSEDENGDDEEEEDDDGTEGHTKDERINKYVIAQSCGRKNSTLVSLKKTMTIHNARGGSAALYKKLCFLHKLRDGDWCLSLLLVRRLMPKQ